MDVNGYSYRILALLYCRCIPRIQTLVKQPRSHIYRWLLWATVFFLGLKIGTLAIELNHYLLQQKPVALEKCQNGVAQWPRSLKWSSN